MTRYCQAAFGDAASEMELFYRAFASQRAPWVNNRGVSPLLGPSGAEKWYLDPLRQFASPPDVFATAARHLDQAVAKAVTVADAKVRQRVEMVATFFELGQTVRQMMEMSDQAFDPTAEVPRASELRDLLAFRKELLMKMRSHSEWFEGTAAGVDEQGWPTWFERPVVDVVRMSENAILATELREGTRRARVERMRILVKRQHAWYDDEQKYTPLSVRPQADSVWFTSTERGAELSDHPKWLGDRKHHWLAALVRDLPLDDTGAMAIDFKASANHGRLTLRATVKGALAAQPAAMVLADFGGDTTSIERRLLVEPLVKGGRIDSLASQRVVSDSRMRSARDRGATVDMHLIWEPKEDDARLSGTMRVERVVWEAE
jgi:hypothetical protein